MPPENTMAKTTRDRMSWRPRRFRLASGYAMVTVKASWTRVPTAVTSTVVTRARVNAGVEKMYS